MGCLNLSAHKIGGWKAQADRVWRWHARLVNSSANSASSPDERIDFFLTFCQNCYALRDWLEKDNAVPKDRLDTLIQGLLPLRICRDIANGSKHLKVNSPSIDANFSIGREYCGSEKPEQWFVIAGDDLVDVLALADQCVTGWKKFLKDQGLYS